MTFGLQSKFSGFALYLVKKNNKCHVVGVVALDPSSTGASFPTDYYFFSKNRSADRNSRSAETSRASKLKKKRKKLDIMVAVIFSVFSF